jgi:hypothetical protein
MGTMTNSNLDTYIMEYFDNMERFTNNHKMMVLRRFQSNIRKICTSEMLIPFLENMKNAEYVKTQWKDVFNNDAWIKRHSILLHDDLVKDIASYARIFLDQFTLVDLYKFFPKDSTIYWQKIGGKSYNYGYKTTFQFYSAIPYNSDYPFSIVTGAISDAMDLEMDGYFIIIRGDDPTTDLWRLAEMMYGDKDALKFKQM